MKPPPNHTSRVLQVGVRGEAPKGGQPISMNRSPTSILETCTGTLPGSLCVKRPRGPWQLCLMDIHNGSSKGNRIGVTMGNPVEARVAVPAACSVGTMKSILVLLACPIALPNGCPWKFIYVLLHISLYAAAPGVCPRGCPACPKGCPKG